MNKYFFLNSDLFLLCCPSPPKMFFLNSRDNSCSVPQPLNIALTWGKHSAKVRAQNVVGFDLIQVQARIKWTKCFY